MVTLYFDAILRTVDSGWEWTNQLFYEAYDNLNQVAYGFSQFHDTWVIEDRLVAANSWRTGGATVSLQLSPSLRYTNFEHGDDYTNEYFDRRDLTRPAGPLDTRLLATQIDDDYTEYYIGDYMDLGLAALADVTWDNGFNVPGGGSLRHDRHGKPPACGEAPAGQRQQLLRAAGPFLRFGLKRRTASMACHGRSASPTTAVRD